MGKTLVPTIRSIIQRIKDEKIQFLDLKFVDLFGTLQHLTLTAHSIDEGDLAKGFGFDGSSILGFQSISNSDLILRPDPASVFVDPFFEEPTLSFFCDIISPQGNIPYPRDPRGVARRAQNLLRAEGIAEQAFFGPELEFFIFDDVRFDQSTQFGYYYLNNAAAFWSTGREGKNLGHIAARKRAYMAAPPVDQYNNLRSKISQVLRLVGLDVELHHHEVAAAGQSEIGFKFGPLVEQADKALKYKYVVRNVVDRYDKTVTFMPKPLHQENGSGMHVNMSLMKDGKNVFYEPNRYADLSELADQFIAGILAHAPALCAICNPTTNSYRRLVPGYEAPMNLVYSQSNRSACIRIPATATSPKAKRIEFRTPDPSGNPYLTFAAILMAGIDGVRKKMVPPPPVDEDIYKYVASGRGKDLKSTPASLEDALQALEKDHDFLIANDVFSVGLLETWIDYKRKQELEYINLRPHPSEFILYFNV
ncbi:MAG: type I glutamate--ammonia ligase [Bacteroidetes bacterium]|nr:MAG: type I glutamate--ammonia ligase [Bacteroidota bacterium]